MPLNYSYLQIAKLGHQKNIKKEKLVKDSIYQKNNFLSLNHFKELKNLLTKGTMNYNTIPYEIAKVYNKKLKKEIYSGNRKCKKYTNDDPLVFKFIENNFMPYLKIKGSKLKLLKNHYDVLNYKKGDKFNKHKDFVKNNSPFIKTYSALFCLKGSDIGGETKVWFDGYKYPYTGQASRNTNGIFIFNSEQYHEGCEIKSGNKIVLKFDLVRFENSFTEKFDGESIIRKSKEGIDYKFRLSYYLNTIKPLFKNIPIESLSFMIINKFLKYLASVDNNYMAIKIIMNKLNLDMSLLIIDYLIEPTTKTNNYDIGYTFCNLRLSFPTYYPYL